MSLNVAAILPQAVCDLFNGVAQGVEAKVVPSIAALADDGDILLAVPCAELDRSAPRPAGWPFSLRWVHLLTTGLDTYPRWLFDGVIVTRSPGVSAVPLAEFALATMLSHARGLRELAVRTPEQWEQWTPVPALRLQGRTLGIVGMGSIGRALAQRAHALGMTVIALRKSRRPMPRHVGRAESLEDLFARSDHIVLAAPATDQTRGLVGAAVLAHARKGAHLVNIGRGALVDQDALLRALDEGTIARASLDVTDPEPLPAGHPFYTHPRVDLTPHLAALDDQVLPDLAAMFVRNLALFQEGRPMRWVVRPGEIGT